MEVMHFSDLNDNGYDVADTDLVRDEAGNDEWEI